MGCVVKIVLFLIPAFFFTAATLVALAAFLAVTGSPSTCSERAISPAPALAQQLDQRWDLFSLAILDGSSSIDISEVEATARAREYLEAEDVPVEDVRVYFCGVGKGQLAGQIAALGIDVDFVLTGHLDLSGPRPVIALDAIDVGNMPGFVSDAALDLLLDDGARTLELDENLIGSEIADGRIIITGEP